MTSKLPLQTLPVFLAAARLQNLRATASEVHLTHGAVSQQIKLLESAIGCALFERRGRGLVLNEAGQTLQAALEPALLAIQRGVAAAQAVSGRQTLRLSVLPSFAQCWLLPRLAQFQQRYPGIALNIDATIEVRDLVKEGFDLGLRLGDGNWPGLIAQQLQRGHVVPVAAPALASRLQHAPVSSWLQHGLLEHYGAPWQRWLALQGVAEEAEPVATFNDAGLLVLAAEQGLGIALSRQILVADRLCDGRLVALHAPTLIDAVDLWAVRPAYMAMPAAVAVLLAWLAESLQTTPPQ